MKALKTLLDIRYAPLLFAAAPQAYAIYLWLWLGGNGTTAAFIFAILGALGYETVYVGAIAWTEDGRLGWGATLTAVTALLFSVAVAIYVHRAQGYAALLHAGFPLTAFAYTMHMHAAARERASTGDQAAQLARALEQTRADLARSEVTARTWERTARGFEADLARQPVEVREVIKEVARPVPTVPTRRAIVDYVRAELARPNASLKAIARELELPETTIRGWVDRETTVEMRVANASAS